MALLHGFDVSGYNPNAIRKCNFVFVKASEGKSYRSGSFTAQWKSANANADWQGGYHYAHPEQSSANDQADRFMDIVEPQPGEGLCLDLEASKLNQSETNTWARKFGDRLWDKAPGVTTVAYFGSGYASNGTGKDLKNHFDYWWYAQYPGKYQVALAPVDVEELRATNRSHAHPYRTSIAAMTTSWPPAVSPWLPSGLTCGWETPHLWQFTDNWQGWDASVTALTLDQLAGSDKQPTPMQEDDMLSGKIPAGKGDRDPILFPAGAFKTVAFGWDNTYANTDLGITRQPPAQLRIALHQAGRKGAVPQTVTVGAALDDAKGWADNVKVTLPAGCDRIDVTRLDEGARAVGFYVA